MKILVINPGSTSTKVAMYQDNKQLWIESIEHSLEWLFKFPNINSQLESRYELISTLLAEKGEELTSMSAIASRGGLLPPVQAGAYEVNQKMVDILRDSPRDQHASNLGAQIALKLAKKAGIKAYIYDSVTVDEMLPIVKVTGLKECERHGQGHNLNMRAAAIKTAEQYGKPYDKMTIIVAHLGGGITFSLHSNGRIIDMISDDEGSFSPERAGGLPCYQLLELAFSGEFTKQSMMAHLQRKGGLMSLMGTTDFRELEALALQMDERAMLVYEAMALNVAKNIAKLSAVVCGNVDAITLTGGIAYSKMFTSSVSDRVKFIAPVTVIPGENEMNALAEGIGRVVNDREKAKTLFS